MEKSWLSTIQAGSNLLQNCRSGASHIHYFIFNPLVLDSRDLTSLPLTKRRELVKSLKLESTHIRIAEHVALVVATRGLARSVICDKDRFASTRQMDPQWLQDVCGTPSISRHLQLH
jgi:hypothetical protein